MLILQWNIINPDNSLAFLPLTWNIMEPIKPLYITFNIIPDMTVEYKKTIQQPTVNVI